VRVLQVYKDYYPVRGGIEHHVQLLAEGLHEQGVEVDVLVTSTGWRTIRQVINGVRVTKTGRLCSVSSAPISPRLYPSLARLARGADIVHLHAPYPPAEVGELFLRAGDHLVLSYHSDIVRQRVLGFLYRPLLWRVLRLAERITVSSPQYIETSVFLRPFAQKCAVIHHGIDLTRFEFTGQVRERAAKIRSQYGGWPIVLTVGKLRHYKGIDVLIRALRDVDAQALIVGTGPLADTWKQLAADAGVADRVRFLGEVPDEQLVALYYAADVLAFPSTNRAETWGTVQIEAMACGLPVVCTELGTGTSYVNQHGVTGLVVAPSDADGLATALRKLVADPALRRQMGEAGQRRAHAEFSKEATITCMLALYQDILGWRC
jgi:glycosyltransferase involved in cell wall biosynthesis